MKNLQLKNIKLKIIKKWQKMGNFCLFLAKKGKKQHFFEKNLKFLEKPFINMLYKYGTFVS